MRKVLKGIKSRISSNKPSGEAISSEDDVATLRHAFETTAADRDRLSQELETYRHAFETTEADRDRLLEEFENYKNVVETMTQDQDLIVGELSNYKHAFESTEADRDTQSELLQKYSTLLTDSHIGLLAYSLMRELNVPLEDVSERLEGAIKRHEAAVSPNGRDANTPNRSPRRRASDGLLNLAQELLRDAQLSDFAMGHVETALQLDDGFRGINHALEIYFRRCGDPQDYASYFDQAVSKGEWPDQGTRMAQQQAIEGGLPSILLTTLPKSGSIYIWSTIMKSLNIPHFRVALSGETATEETLLPSLIKVFSEGGFITQQHLAPSTENIRLLKENGVSRFIVHFRDPRQAAVSWWHYNAKIGAMRPRERSREEIEDVIWKGFLSPAAIWLNGWIDIADSDEGLELFLSTHEELAGNEERHIKKMLDFLRIPESAYALQGASKTEETHFRKGAKSEWLEFFSDDFKKRSLDLVPNELAERFGWVQI